MLFLLGEFPYAKCFICGETGHLSRTCPDNPKGLYAQGIKILYYYILLQYYCYYIHGSRYKDICYTVDILFSN